MLSKITISIGVALTLMAPSFAEAQTLRSRYEREARRTLDSDVRADLDAADERLEVANNLMVSAAVLIGVGLAGLLGGSIGTLVCGDDCAAVHGVLAASAGLAAIGVGLVVAGTLVGNDAREQRRRLMRESFALVPLPGGVQLTFGGVF